MAMIADSPHEGVEPNSSTRTTGPDGTPDALRVAGVRTNGIESTANGTDGARPDDARVNGVPSVVPKAGKPELAAVGRKPVLPDSEELFRAIYTRAGLTMPGIVAVSSAVAGEGKSTIALGLAIMVAQDFPDRRVLLVETDLQHPSLASDFDVEPSPGLAEALDGVYPVQMGYRQTFLDNLRVLPAGSEFPNPSRLLRSTRLTTVMETTRRSNDVVIMDAPSLLTNSDASLVNDVADGVILVVRSGVVMNGAQSSVPGWLRRIFGF